MTGLIYLCCAPTFPCFPQGRGGGGGRIRKSSHFAPTDKGTASEEDQLQEILKVGETSNLCNIFYYLLFLLSTGESLTSRYSRNTDQRLHTSFSSGDFARLKPKDMSSPLVSDHSDNGRRVISPIRRRSDDDVCIRAYLSPGFFFFAFTMKGTGRCSLLFQRSVHSYDDKSVNETRTCNLLSNTANLV